MAFACDHRITVLTRAGGAGLLPYLHDECGLPLGGVRFCFNHAPSPR
jgi:hypothetical protein